MPTILPADPPLRLQSISLTALSAVGTQYLLSIPPSNQLDLFRTAATLLLPTLTFSFLQSRYITLQRAAALRLSLPATEFKTAMKAHTILTATGMSTIFAMLCSTALLSNLPLLYSRLMQGDVASWVRGVERPVSWFFATVNLTIVIVCWAMMFTQEPMTFTFERTVKDDEVPLEKLKKGKGWKKVCSTSRRHDVWVQSVHLPGGQDVGVFDMTTRLASNHPLYSAEKDTQPSGPTLRISLP
ncbi:hypothetical protein PSEUBRA_002993 [Kalmanozyma brasiliensis GHG001]|uniref:Uncharacterized protein n=1 Tax=Kalmanozyma brasiliensis (strain GHG001) TaxID=1365824 RepID=V5GPI1_KALBG|nr:uncharacterized protein PSEUBRA_002993 [Kalmanozyma brasiliensis GHG001]EST07872.1 hypothetical protein PSEUBRA_002993 [Kalmanozyma brasiliensis GHG001]